VPRGGRTAKHDRPGVSFPSKEGKSIMTSNDPAADRAAFIAALRDLAGFLAAHPDVPVPPGYCETRILLCPQGSEAGRLAAVDQAAAALGVQPSIPDGSDYYTAGRSFGPVTYEVLACTDAARADHTAQSSYYGAVTADGAAA